ncbi:MAG: DEAD/DEAH box helicase [Candidatus Diapherotrites archaeon]
MDFSDLKLNERLAQAIQAKGYAAPSEVQVKALPFILEEKDVIVQARTGTGKTAAFAIPILEKLAGQQGHTQALVLVPTRELADQVQKEFAALAKGQGIFCAAVYGGQSIGVQRGLLNKGQHVVVATPGRLIDLMNRGWIKLDAIKFVVLDEADKMFDMGFRDDIEFVLARCPKQRQTMLFSATTSDDILSMAERHLRPDRVSVNVSQDKVAVDEISQFYISVEPKKRLSILAALIQDKKMTKCLVFCRTRRTADWVSKQLTQRRVPARSIHGGLEQNVRQRIIEGFRSDKIPVLVTTDLLARGMDIQDISHIINFDFPKEKETYVHRIGRTARFGKTGEAITFCTNVMEIQELENIQSSFRTEIVELVETA